MSHRHNKLVERLRQQHRERVAMVPRAAPLGFPYLWHRPVSEWWQD